MSDDYKISGWAFEEQVKLLNKARSEIDKLRSALTNIIDHNEGKGCILCNKVGEDCVVIMAKEALKDG